MSEPRNSHKPRRALSRAFALHYAEMALVMLIGMAVLAVPVAWASAKVLPGAESDDPALMLARMALTMTVPMVPWMLWRGHGWRPSVEMAAAMIVPAIAVIALFEAGLVEGVALLMTIEHVAMFAAMFAVMIARPEEYGDGHSIPARRRRDVSLRGRTALAQRGASR